VLLNVNRTQKKILHIAHGLSSYNNSLVELIGRLIAADIQIVVASHVNLSSVLQATGVEFIHLQRDQEIRRQMRDEISRVDSKYGLIKTLNKLALYRRYRAKSQKQNELEALFKKQNPDLLLIDMECHVAIVWAIFSRLPTMLCSRWFSVFYSSKLPPLHTALLPRDGIVYYLHVNLLWLQLWLKKLAIAIKYRCSFSRFTPISYRSNAELDLRQIASALGLRISQFTQKRHWLIPFVYTEIPTLSFTAKEMDFVETQNPLMNYVGAMVAGTNTQDSRYGKAILLYLEFIKSQHVVGKPLVYCSLSTFWQSDFNRLSPIIELFRKRTDISLVVGMGGRTDKLSSLSLPDNILIMNYAPQIDILGDASIVITHGGISTINEAICNAVPMIVYSAGNVDQDGCMARVVHHELGLSVESDPISIDELEGHINYLLDKTKSMHIHRRVKKMQSYMKKYDQTNAMVSTLLAAID